MFFWCSLAAGNPKSICPEIYNLTYDLCLGQYSGAVHRVAASQLDGSILSLGYCLSGDVQVLSHVEFWDGVERTCQRKQSNGPIISTMAIIGTIILYSSSLLLLHEIKAGILNIMKV